ncbi:hypothetical protein, partial [Streptococcus suis]|uniref:hypothetical protein n=1 Tax=Streptococcus suis TaxID=1307 RepID=UPI003703E925
TVSVVAFHYRSYGTFCIYSKRLYNLYGGFTHYRNYRAKILGQINLACESIFVEFYSFSPVIFGIINPVYLKLK